MKSPDRQRLAVIALVTLLVCSPRLFALDPSLDISQYAHTSFRIRDGFVRGAINSIAQTPDGYLWLGTEFGLYRFDGVHAVLWQPPSSQAHPTNIGWLLAARDGTLWIGASNGLVSWKNGTLTTHSELAGQDVFRIIEAHDGTIWAGGNGDSSPGKLCAFRAGASECYGEDGSLGAGVSALYEDRKGNLWVGGMWMNGFWRWKPGPPRFFAVPNNVKAFTEDDHGGLLIASHGMMRMRDGKVEPYSIPGVPTDTNFESFLHDRDGGLWVGTIGHGLVHMHQGRAESFTQADGLSNDFVLAVIEDREGSIWAATWGGLERFRPYSIPSITFAQGLPTGEVWSVLGARDGTLWIGAFGGLSRWDQGKISVFGARKGDRKPDGTFSGFSPDCLFEDRGGRIWVSTVREFGYLNGAGFVPIVDFPGGVVHGIAEDAEGSLWVASQQAGLIRVSRGKVVQRIPWARLGAGGVGTALTTDPSGNGLWLGFSRGDVANFADGAIHGAYSSADGLAPGAVNHIRFDKGGALWAATDGGISRIKDGRRVTLNSKNGLPCDAVHWSIEDDEGGLWLKQPCGVVRLARPDLEAWVVDPGSKVRTTLYDAFDGVQGHAIVSSYRPLVTKTTDGRIWFATGYGVSVLDPRHLPVNKLPPPVHIEQVIADDQTYGASSGLRLPSRVRNLHIDYTALSLVVPEKVRFRYKLEDQDKDWRELVNVRHVDYTNLPPKHYKFRVLASNNSGVWNEEGAMLDFVIPPMWYQTQWFDALCATAFLGLLWAAYQLRVRQLAAHFNMRLEERISERTRIARDLHDTLLQSFQGLLLRFQAVINLLPGRPVEARKFLEDAVDHASRAITEGRDSISGLRMSTVEKNDLAVAIETIAEELAAAQADQPSTPFAVLVEGTPREMHPILRDEIYRLATEALRNAFQHAAAQRIEVEIRYDEKYFRLRVRDDGKGIPSDVLSGDGRKGHYGLHGMRERAKIVGGKLTIWSEADSGTEIELIISGAKAYVNLTQPFWYFGKRSASRAHEKETIERE